MKSENRIDCHLFHEQLDDLLAGELSAEARQSMERHIAECPACAAAYGEARRALDAVTPQVAVPVPEGLDRRILDAVRRQAAVQQTATPQPSTSRSAHRRRIFGILSGVLSAAALIAVVLTVGLNTPARAARSNFSRAIASMEKVRSIRIEMRIRTTADENFDYTNPLEEFVPHTLEAIYTPELLWRVEKPGRKALCDGRHIYQWFDASSDGMILPASSGTLGMLNLLIDPGKLLTIEQQFTRTHDGTQYDLRREAGVLHLTVSSPAQGDFSQSDYMRNTSILESDTRREYRFDAASGRLLGARVVFLAGEQERTLLEIDRIEYDAPIDAARLTARPEGINWVDQTQATAPGRLTGIGVEEAGRLILGAFATWDNAILDDALRYYGINAREILKSRYSGATVESLSDPVRSGEYAGWFIPCTLRMADGTTEKIHLALRNDNPEESWVIDGGL